MHIDSVLFYLFFIVGYTTTRPAQFKLQDDGSALAVAALTAVHGE
jgi:hypothetical protein